VTNEKLHNYVLIPKYQADQVKETKVEGACGMQGRAGKKCAFFWWESPKEKETIRKNKVSMGEWGEGGVDSVSSEQELVAGSCEYSDKAQDLLPQT
jgi:hypothetical protein